MFIGVGGDGQPKSGLCRAMTAVGEMGVQSWDMSFESEPVVSSGISVLLKTSWEVPWSADCWREDCSPSAESMGKACCPVMNWKLQLPFDEEMPSKSGGESSEPNGVGRDVDPEFWTTGAERSLKALAEVI